MWKLLRRNPPASWMAIGAVANAVVYAVFEWLRPRQLSWDGLWATRGAVWSGLLLFDTLVMVWWYAALTRHLRDAARTQIDIAAQQVEAAKKQFGLAWTQRREANKPFVVVARQRRPDRERLQGAENFGYVVRNIGTGLAVNVHYAVADDKGRLELSSLGSLAGLGETPIPLFFERRLVDQAGYPRHIVIVAEGLMTRTNRWNVTINVLLPGTDVRHGIAWGKSVAFQGDQTVGENLIRVWPVLERRMKELEQPLGGQS